MQLQALKELLFILESFFYFALCSGVSRGAAEFFTMMKTFVASRTVLNVKNVIISKFNYNLYDYVKILLHKFVIITHYN